MFNGVDFSKLQNESSRSVMPTGFYIVDLQSAEVCQTKAGNGSYVKFIYVVVEKEGEAGKYKGKKIFDNVNIKNPNPKAELIGLQRIKAIFTMCGFSESEMKDKHPKDAVGRRFKVFVKHNDYNGSKSEAIASFAKYEQAQPQAQVKTIDSSDLPPWMK